MPTLTPQEGTLITERLLQDRLDVETAYRQRLELGHEFYVGVKQHLMAILQVWEAILDEKNAFDTLGRMTCDRNFIDSFLLCTDIIPARANIGSLGPSNLQINPAALTPTYMTDPPLVASGNVNGADNDSWQPEQANWQDLLQSRNADVLALSDYEVDDTTTDEEVKDEDEDEDENDENDEYYDEEGDEEDDGRYEGVLRPPTPYFAPLSQVTLDHRRLFDEYEPEEWSSEWEGLVERESEIESPVLEEFTTATGTRPTIEKHQLCEPRKLGTSQKRGLDRVSDRKHESLDEGCRRSKRQRR